MHLPRLFFMSMLVMAATHAFGQSKKEFTGPLPESASPEPATPKAPAHKHGIFSRHRPRPFKVKVPKVTHTAQYEFYRRVEQAAKEHQRALKKLAKPQYSNFLYYGHKRKPKKHPPNKMRYCEECGIRH